MRRICAAFIVMLVAARITGAQDGAVEVLVISRTPPATAGPAVGAATALMEDAVRKELLRLFPCASVTFASDIKTSLEFQKQRQLLNADFDSGLDAMAGALGANYVFSLSVTELGPDQLAMKGSIINAATSQAITTKSGTATADKATRGGEAAWLARQVVQGLGGISRFAKEKCVPTNHWTGTVTYRAAEHREESEQSPLSNNDGTVTNTMTTDVKYDAVMRIGWTGDPKVRVTATDVRRIDEVGKSRYDCGNAGTYGNRAQRWGSMGFVNNTIIESRADTTTRGSVAVEVARGRIELRFTLPSLDGTTKTTFSKKFDGGCDKPTSSNETFDAEWSVPAVHLTVEQAAERLDDEQSGSYKGKDGVTLTWQLKRTPMRP